jgi:hypothetical protein
MVVAWLTCSTSSSVQQRINFPCRILSLLEGLGDFCIPREREADCAEANGDTVDAMIDAVDRKEE